MTKNADCPLLQAMVVQIQAEDDPAHLVSLVKSKFSSWWGEYEPLPTIMLSPP
jgi:hypothetical protein